MKFLHKDKHIITLVSNDDVTKFIEVIFQWKQFFPWLKYNWKMLDLIKVQLDWSRETGEYACFEVIILGIGLRLFWDFDPEVEDDFDKWVDKWSSIDEDQDKLIEELAASDAGPLAERAKEIRQRIEELKAEK